MGAIFRLNDNVLGADRIKAEKELHALGIEAEMMEKLKKDANWSTYMEKQLLKKNSKMLPTGLLSTLLMKTDRCLST